MKVVTQLDLISGASAVRCQPWPWLQPGADALRRRWPDTPRSAAPLGHQAVNHAGGGLGNNMNVMNQQHVAPIQPHCAAPPPNNRHPLAAGRAFNRGSPPSSSAPPPPPHCLSGSQPLVPLQQPPPPYFFNSPPQSFNCRQQQPQGGYPFIPPGVALPPGHPAHHHQVLVTDLLHIIWPFIKLIYFVPR